MKLTSAISSPNFYYYGTNDANRHRSIHVEARPERPAPAPENGDEMGRKQEVVCAVILALSSISTAILCLWQLAA